jgi:hypothetical protein
LQTSTVMVSHASTTEWQSFEMRMRRRRAERLLLRADVAAEAGYFDDARECLSEVRTLLPSMAGLAEAELKVREYAERPPSVEPVASADPVASAEDPGSLDFLMAEATDREDPVASGFRRKIIPWRKIIPIAAGLAIAVALVAARVQRSPGPAPASHHLPADSGSIASTPPADATVARERVALDRFPGPGASTPPPEAARAALTRPENAPPEITGPVSTTGVSTSTSATRSQIDRADLESPRPGPRDDLPRLAASAGTSNLPGVTTGAVSVPAAPGGNPVALREAPSAPALEPVSLPDPILPATTPAARIGTPVEASSQEAIVRRVLNRYAAAYSDLDADAAERVWPGVNRAALSRAFDALASQRVSLGDCKIQIAVATAEARCAGSATWSPKVGSGGSRTEQRNWTFELARGDGGWQIVRARVQNR